MPPPLSPANPISADVHLPSPALGTAKGPAPVQSDSVPLAKLQYRLGQIEAELAQKKRRLEVVQEQLDAVIKPGQEKVARAKAAVVEVEEDIKLVKAAIAAAQKEG